jgi:hypothetical protein
MISSPSILHPQRESLADFRVCHHVLWLGQLPGGSGQGANPNHRAAELLQKANRREITMSPVGEYAGGRTRRSCTRLSKDKKLSFLI